MPTDLERLSVDKVVEQSLQLLQTAITVVRNSSVPLPQIDAAKMAELHAATDELHRAVQVRANDGDVNDDMTSAEKHEFEVDLSALTIEVQQFTDTVNEQVKSWKHAAHSAARADVAKLRRIECHDENVAQLAKKSLEFCKRELLACCSSIERALETPQTNVSNDHPSPHEDDSVGEEDGDDEDLRNPISATEGSAFPFQHLHAADISSSKAIWEWLLNTLPSNAHNTVGVFYRRVDLRQMLLKCIVCADQLDLDNTPQLHHLTKSCVEQLNAHGGAQEDDVLRCVADAFTTLFLYTVNLDGHFADPVSQQPLSAAVSVELLKTIEWPRQMGDKTGPKVPDASVAIKIPSASKPPPNNKAHGYNPAIWAVANWTLRISGDPVAPAVLRQEAHRGARAYRVFAEHLAWALNLLPPAHCTVYRGIKGRTTRPYVQNTMVAWPAFSSTSTKDKEALNFMGKEQGTFFIVHCDTARDIAFCSWFPNQAELLLPPARHFKVQSRVSNTVLTMLESNAELISMRENRVGVDSNLQQTTATQIDDAVVVDQAVNAVARTVFIYEAFMKRYVPGKFTTKRGNISLQHIVGIRPFVRALSGCEDATTEQQEYSDSDEEYIDERRVKVQHGNIIVGDGGTGKTSAMLYVLSALATNRAASIHVVPVFVSLPALQISNPHTQAPLSAPIDAFVCSALGLESGEQLAILAAKCKLIVLLDSLDEVVPHHRQHLHNCLSKNPLLKAHASHIIVSTRSEALQDAQAMLADTEATATFHCVPFNIRDTRKMLKLAAARWNKSSEDIEKLWQQLEEWRVLPALANPFVASMCIETALSDPSHLSNAHKILVDEPWHMMKETTVYESYLKHKLSAKKKDGGGGGGGDLHAKRPRFQQATNIACQLTSMQTSHATIEQLGRETECISTVLRYESLEPTSSASFRHKSLQEYFVARAISTELYAASPLASAKTLLQSLPRLDRLFPNVVRLTALILLGNGATFSTATEALALIACDRTDPSCTGVALSILARTGCSLASLLPPRGLSEVTIHDTRLDGASFVHLNMEGATFTDCVLTNCRFSERRWKERSSKTVSLASSQPAKAISKRSIQCVSLLTTSWWLLVAVTQPSRSIASKQESSSRRSVHTP